MTGRPVDIEIVPRAHAILSASSAERWLTCTPSARIEEALEDSDSSYATDGTAAHAFAELRLRYKLRQTTKAEYLAAYDATKTLFAEVVEEWEQFDWDSINEYVDYVLEEAKRLGGKIEIEARVDYSKYAQGGFGTSDVLIVSGEHKVIKSIDLKFGKGVPVYADGNPQARLYALGGYLSVADLTVNPEEWSVEYTIHQPRLNSVSTEKTELTELIEWAETVVAPAAKLAWEGKGNKVPTDKGCRFCKARAVCRERAAVNALVARRDFMGEPEDRFKMTPGQVAEHLMGMDEVARILPLLDDWMSWARGLQQYALEQVRDHGKEIDGYKLVRGRSNRVWAKDPEEVKAALMGLGVSETTVMQPPAEPTVRSVAQLEKALGAKQYRELKVEEALVTKSPGTPTLVPATDPRPAMNQAAEARNSFESE